MRITTSKQRRRKKAAIVAVAILSVAIASVAFALPPLLKDAVESQVTASNSPEQSSSMTNKEEGKQTQQKQQKQQASSTHTKEGQKPVPVDTEGANEDFSTMERPTVDEIEEAQKNIDQASDQFVGQIEIPAIELKLNILEGTTYQKMLYGATTLLPESVIGKGNYALASHNMGVEGKMFTSIHKLQAGDAIYLTNQEGQRFEYSVVSNKVVDYRNTDSLNLTKDPTVTLITCETVTDTPNRVIVQATLVS